ncbi:MAG: ABC transporter substrate-binding protein [Proteobacteria bacterium]|jgi:phospholipid transport system substrate-binding protein|nr:ABC transporter substrate-binding protein [Pseudomonadota bacterium]
MLKHSYHARFSLWHLVLLVVILTVTLPAIAQSEDPPTRILKQTSTQMLTALHTYRAILQNKPRYVFILVNEILAPRVDMETASRLALGKHWRSATSEQRRRFTTEFRNLLVRYYSLTLMTQLDMQDLPVNVIEFLPGPQLATRYQVHSRVNIPHHQAVDVDYAVHRVDNAWKVYDIRVGGISLVTAYRSVFASEIHQHGLDGLIERLAEKNKQLLAT